jgi:N6-adenosine-specific RNA methylase IME4
MKASLGKPARRDIRQEVVAPVGRHSEKPVEVYDRIEALYPNATPRLELFARKRWPGWNAWGNQVEDAVPLLQALGGEAPALGQAVPPKSETGLFS